MLGREHNGRTVSFGSPPRDWMTTGTGHNLSPRQDTQAHTDSGDVAIPAHVRGEGCGPRLICTAVSLGIHCRCKLGESNKKGPGLGRPGYSFQWRLGGYFSLGAAAISLPWEVTSSSHWERPRFRSPGRLLLIGSGRDSPPLRPRFRPHCGTRSPPTSFLPLCYTR